MSQKKAAFVFGLASLIGVSVAHAQSSVTLFGHFDNTLAYVQGGKGKSTLEMTDGNHIGSGFGLRGVEDLGGGTKAVFLLENGFSTPNGAFAASGSTARMFGRQAWLGFTSDRFGTLTFGRQYDFMLSGMCKYSSGCLLGSPFDRAATTTATISTLLGGNGSNADLDRLGGARVDSAIKYTSSNFNGAGLSFGSMYGLGGTAGSLTNGSTYSFYTGYSGGPLSLGLTYTNKQDQTSDSHYTVLGLGGSYTYRQFVLDLLLTQDRWTAHQDVVNGVDVNARYAFTPSFTLLFAYTFSDPNHGSTNLLMKGKRHTAGFEADYFLSKRTDLYASFAYQKAEDGQKAQFVYQTDSSLSWATMTQVGIRHRF